MATPVEGRAPHGLARPGTDDDGTGRAPPPATGTKRGDGRSRRAAWRDILGFMVVGSPSRRRRARSSRCACPTLNGRTNGGRGPAHRPARDDARRGDAAPRGPVIAVPVQQGEKRQTSAPKGDEGSLHE
jgi:hypothetical protein